MKKVLLSNLVLDESSMLSTSEKRNLFGGITYLCSDCRNLAWESEMLACLANCSNGGSGGSIPCNENGPCDPSA